MVQRGTNLEPTLATLSDNLGQRWGKLAQFGTFFAQLPTWGTHEHPKNGREAYDSSLGACVVQLWVNLGQLGARLAQLGLLGAI